MCFSLTDLFLKCFSDEKILPVANEETMKTIGVKRKHAKETKLSLMFYCVDEKER